MSRLITKAIIHCSDSNFGNVDLIRDWHLQRNFKDIGYHYVICNGYVYSTKAYEKNADGRIETGRPIEEIGAHAAGYNKHSVGICLIGKHRFSIQQLISLLKLLESLCLAIPGLNINKVYGHKDFNKHKTCPNFDVAIIRSLLKTFQEFNND